MKKGKNVFYIRNNKNNNSIFYSKFNGIENTLIFYNSNFYNVGKKRKTFFWKNEDKMCYYK